MYFIIMSLLSRRSALPSISCFRNRSACTASDGSCAAIKCITSSMVQSLVWPRGICTCCTGAGVTTAVVIVVTVPAAGTSVLGGIVGTSPADDDDAGQTGDGTKGTARVCVLCGMIVFGRGVVEDCAGGGVGTGAMFAVGVTCGDGVAWAGDRADADEDDAAAMAAAACTAAAEAWRSVLTAMLVGVGVEVASGDTTIVDVGVG